MPKRRCVIIGSSPDTEVDSIARNLRGHDFIACADGGYLYAQKLNLRPDLIIGDFDSSPKPKNIAGRILSLPREKDDTDTMYLVRECVRLGFEEFVFFGCTGGRLDHTFANFCVLQYLSQKNCTAEMLDKENLIFILQKGVQTIDYLNGKGFSIFPFGCHECSVTLKGFAYELEDGILTADFPLGVSNIITSDNAFVEIKDGSALIIIQHA